MWIETVEPSADCVEDDPPIGSFARVVGRSRLRSAEAGGDGALVDCGKRAGGSALGAAAVAWKLADVRMLVIPAVPSPEDPKLQGVALGLSIVEPPMAQE